MLLAERAESERLRQIIKELQRHRFGRRAESLPTKRCHAPRARKAKKRTRMVMTESRYTRELANSILERVSNGDSVRQASRSLAIPEASFRQWVRDDRDGLALRYAQARALQID